MMRHIFLLMILLSFTTQATDIPAKLKRCGSTSDGIAITGDEISLPSGERIKLAGIKAPSLRHNDQGNIILEKSWPYSMDARDALESLIEGQKLTFYCVGRRKDYRGRLIAFVYAGEKNNKIAVNEALLKEGYAWTYPNQYHKVMQERLYDLEDQARDNNKGLWSRAGYSIKRAKNPKPLKTRYFYVIRGTVTSAKKVGKWVYLNFGHDYKTDFTIRLTLKAASEILKMLNTSDLDGYGIFHNKTVEVRGYVTYRGGPMITLSDAGKLRFIKPE